MKSPLCWYGGKTKSVKFLLPLIPKHKTYVEVFAGSAALLFAKERSKVEILNDINKDLVNFYRVLRDEQLYDILTRMLITTPYSKTELRNAYMMLPTTTDPVKRAYYFFILVRQSFSATMNRSFCNPTHHINQCSRWLSAIDRLPEAVSILSRCHIECASYEHMINMYDSEDTFFYLDPPYIASTRKCIGYKHEMRGQDHKKLVTLLLSIKGTALLSCYDHDIYKSLIDNGWKTFCYDNHLKTAPKNLDNYRKETIYIHPRIASERGIR